jgi:hypothetical protein
MTTNNNLLTADSPSEFFRILMELENLEKIEEEEINQIPILRRQTNMPQGVSFPEEELLSIYPAGMISNAATSLTEADLPTNAAALIKHAEEEDVKEKCRECDAMIWPDEDVVCFDCYSKHVRECLEDPGDIPQKYRFDSV